VTTTTTKRFQWIDRDTAARDLLQLVYHAPESVSKKAVHLLKAIRSPAVIPELQAIMLDDQRTFFERKDALDAIIETPGDIYMPELYTALHFHNEFGVQFPEGNQLFRLADCHPSNRIALFDYIDSLSPESLSVISQHFAHSIPESIAPAFYDRLMAVLEAHPNLLDLDTVKKLYYRDKREATKAWLAAQWQRLVYLCLSAEIRAIVPLLENWEELRNVVFYSCPMIVLEYHPIRAEIQTMDIRTKEWHEEQRPTKDFMQSKIWIEREQLYAQALEGDQQAARLLARLTRNGDILERAAAIYFFGKLPDYPNFIVLMISLLRFARDPWIRPDRSHSRDILEYPISAEAAQALHNHPSPQVWKALVDAYFGNVAGGFLLKYSIAYQTDILSGLEVQNIRGERELEYVSWFQALAEREEEA
jgi:hypothetical protein